MSTQQEPVSLDLDRRSFMKASALAGGVALGVSGAGRALQESGEETDGTDTDTELTKTICNYCSVGCGFRGEKEGNSFVGMEPWHEHPINAGSLCSKGAGIYETEHSEKRLKHPMVQEDGEWRKMGWNEAYDRLATDIRALWPDDDVSPSEAVDVDAEHSRESVMLLGSAHHSNEESYAIRKLAAFMGTNNVDHQARICHSTTVAGLANTWGYGAMTNTVNDYRNFDLNIIIGQNPAEAHPIAMQHILEGQKRGGTILNLDPRFTKTSAHADEFMRFRPGTDVALMMGVMKYLRDEHGLAMDSDADDSGQNMLADRVQGWEDIDAELDEYDLETVSDITWVSVEDIQRIGDLINENRPNIQIEWAMGGTQHNNGTQNIRSYAATSLASGSAARSGGGLQVMRGHANVQGATDLAVASHILPGYYGLTPGGWSWWADVWDKNPYTSGSTSFEDMYGKFELMPEDLYVRQSAVAEGNEDIDTSMPADNSMMFQNGLTVARWFEGALNQGDRYQETPIYQPDQVKIAFFWGHSANSISEMEQMKEGMENLDLLVVVDVFPSVASVLPDFEEGPPVLLLPASSQYEHYRSLTNTHRATQWSEPVRSPAHNSKPDLQIMQELAGSLGFGEHFDWGEGEELYNGKATYEAVVREFNLGTMTIGYRQDPERLQQHLEYDYAFSSEDLQGAEGTPVEGEYWMLPWPCWGEGHPGTPIIWNDDMNPNNGGQDFRTRWGVQAPTESEWGDMPTDDEYPFQATMDAVGDRYESEEEALDLTRAPYDPDWADPSDKAADGMIHGVPEYPGWKTTFPESLLDPNEKTRADELTIPQQHALAKNGSVYTAAQELNNPMSYGQGASQSGAQPALDIDNPVFDWTGVQSEAFAQHLQDTHDIDAGFYEEYDHRQVDAPTGRGRARAVVWNFLDKVPVHREPIESPRPDLVEEWPANGQQRNFYRLDQNNEVEQQRATDIIHNQEEGPDLDTIMTTGRQVEHQGGGSETRSNIHTADLQPHMYAEITPDKAEELGVDGGDLVVVSSTDKGSVLVKARVTDRPNDGEIFLPFHWGGVFKGQNLEDKYPDGTTPYAIGDSVNAITARGYDVETQMQETKVSMVAVRPATESLLEELNMDPDISFPQDRNNIGTQKDFDVRDNSTVQ
ncbi:formate dehydrogenase subunit alpha [Haloarcula sp. 1CSR25-25]|uniref:formate dehydrogenase subunit alpha n=1 Tax=Haloarcula sp. 1CSR25-25 TaxID=2862545 RepID=UPI002895DA9F|nr:formate dehydrogenase subunit alpha [Haloarcula sp. 1CSR25-25]MDT3436484.1 formate dehydrogenase subunit alpha [Haloarcula sp. 1CSR25-25]